MIKCETAGMISNSKNDPVLTSENAVANYSFLTVDGILYLIANTISGDDSYVDNMTIAAGEPLNGFQVDEWAGQKLVIDERHIAYASGKAFADLEAGTTLLTVNTDGALAVASAAPDSGVYFKVTDKLTGIGGNQIKARILVA